MEEKQYVTEWANENLGLTLKITKMLHEEQTPYQKIQIADTLEYGHLLILDGVFQTSVKDEWTYHEMISHVPLMLHPNPERVLIIGGGDGGVAREVCRHDCVKQVDLCDIDGRVIELSKEYFPTIASALLDPPEKTASPLRNPSRTSMMSSSSTAPTRSDPVKAFSPANSTRVRMKPSAKTDSSSSRQSPRSCSKRPSMTSTKPWETYSRSSGCTTPTCRSIRPACIPSCLHPRCMIRSVPA